MTHPFYYFGAGVKTWYSINRVDMHIKFIEKPTKEQIQKILDIVPPCVMSDRTKESILETYESNIMVTFSDSITKQLYRFYGGGSEKCTQETYENFDKTVEKWFLQVHKICPIEAVVRETESSYDVHSEWHTDSVNNANDLLEKWKNEPKEWYRIEELQGEAFEEMIKIISKYLKDANIQARYTASALKRDIKNSIKTKLEDLNLEITLPKDYGKIIFERRDISPELAAEGFHSGVWGKDRKYNFVVKNFEPFYLRVIEKDLTSDESELEYQLNIEADSVLFTPLKLQKYLRNWSMENNLRGKKSNFQWAKWIIQQCKKLSGENFYNNKYQIEAPMDGTDIDFITPHESVFYQLCKDVSTAFRRLSVDLANVEEPSDYEQYDVEIIEDKRSMKDLRAIKKQNDLDDIFRNIACNNFIAAAYFAVQGAVKVLKADHQKVNNIYFVVDVSGERIKFTYEDDIPEDPDDDDDDSYYYIYKVQGKALEKFDALCEKLKLSCNQEACYYFGEALEILDRKGVFDDVIDEFLEIMGKYDYYGDMEGILIKEKE
ncbi:hypothetical protein FACS1894180_7870 [Bacteroidia bacterium]|nr:hypothetical protein FACS1894180_7870 [Bacteroidia bacterium]